MFYLWLTPPQHKTDWNRLCPPNSISNQTHARRTMSSYLIIVSTRKILLQLSNENWRFQPDFKGFKTLALKASNVIDINHLDGSSLWSFGYCWHGFFSWRPYRPVNCLTRTLLWFEYHAGVILSVSSKACCDWRGLTLYKIDCLKHWPLWRRGIIGG